MPKPRARLLVLCVFRRTLALCALMATLLLVPRPARGAPDNDAYSELLGTAIAARDRALESGAPGDWQHAFELLSELVRLRATKGDEFELANAAAHLGRDDEAYAAYEKSLALGLGGRGADQATAFIEAARPRMALLDIAGTSGAMVYVRGILRAVLPLSEPLVVTAGNADVTVAHPSHAPFSTRVLLEPGTSSKVVVEFTQPAPKNQRDKQPPTPADSGKPATNSWAVPLSVSGGAVLVVGVGAIVGTTVALAGQRQKLEENCLTYVDDECLNALPQERDTAQEAADAIQTLKALRAVAIGASALGAVALGVGSYSIWATPSGSPSAKGPTISLSPNGAWFAWQGAW